MGVAGGIAGAFGGLMGGIGARQQQGKQNEYYQQAAGMFNPKKVRQGAQKLDPYLFNAMSNPAYGQNLANLAANPGYIDPSLMNMPFHLSSMRANQDMNRAQSILGRTLGGTGVSGIGNAYALANQAGRTARDVGTAQQYTLFREQQRRADLAFLQNEMARALGMSGNLAGGAAGMYSQQAAPMNWMQIGANTISGAMSGASGKAQPTPQASSTQQGSYGNFWGQGNQGPLPEGGGGW